MAFTATAISVLFCTCNAYNLFPSSSWYHRVSTGVSSKTTDIVSLPYGALTFDRRHSRKSLILRCEAEDEQYYDDETYEEWLQDMIFSGDMIGYVRRNAKAVSTNDFLLFLNEKLENFGENGEDEDERNVLLEVIAIIDEKLKQTDGLVDSALVFESRLDKILFAPPNQRKTYIEENINDMSVGFVEYIQRELRASADTDSKVILPFLFNFRIVEIIRTLYTGCIGKYSATNRSAEADPVGRSCLQRHDQAAEASRLQVKTNDVILMSSKTVLKAVLSFCPDQSGRSVHQQPPERFPLGQRHIGNYRGRRIRRNQDRGQE